MATRKRNTEKSLDPSGPNDSDEHLVQLTGIRRFLISLTGKTFERALLWRLDWFNFLYVSLRSKVPSLIFHENRPELISMTEKFSVSQPGVTVQMPFTLFARRSCNLEV